MSEAGQTDDPQGLVDIEFSPPDPATPTAAAPCVVGLLLLAGLLLTWRSVNPRARASRRLARLRKRLRAGRLEPRRAAFQLAAVLRRSFGVSALSGNTPLPPRLEADAARWRRFNQRLADARYATPEPGRSELEWLCAEARHWLRHWPGHQR